jgi:hypothetical protein
MEDTELKKLLRVQKQTGERTRRCPDENQLAAYVSKRLEAPAATAIERHIADCDFCVGQIAFLSQTPDAETVEQVPFALLSRARSILGREPKSSANWAWRWAAPSAAVACLILIVVVVVVQLRRRETVSPNEGPFIAQKIEPPPIASPQIAITPPALRSEPSPPTQMSKSKPTRTAEVRSNTSEEMIPRLLTPREGAAVRKENLELRWQPVSDAMFYEVRLMSAAGDVVFEQQTENTSLKPGAAAPLIPGTKYFVVVSAHLRQGKTEKSALISFRLIGQ